MLAQVSKHGRNSSRMSETAFNMALVNALCSKDSKWLENGCVQAESIGQIENEPSMRPDIIISHPQGVPVVVETEFQPAQTVEVDAASRLGRKLISHNGAIEQAIAVKIPIDLAYEDQGAIENKIDKSEIEYCVHSLKFDSLMNESRWPETGWATGNIDDLADVIELAAMSENILKSGMDILQDAISNASDILRTELSDTPDVLNEIAMSLHQRDSLQTTRMAISILINAITFHMSMVGHGGIKSLDEIWGPIQPLSYDKNFLLDYWNYVIKEINFLPVFDIAIKVITPINDKVGQEILKVLHHAALQLNELGVTSRHDFYGRMFQSLISDRKFLATFYTLPASASLLAELAVDRIKIEWSNDYDLKNMKIADFACGTGALLNASMHSVISKYKKTGRDDRKIQKFLVEDVITGTDIMPAATHLTASMLAGVHPGVTFDHTSIFTLPYGKNIDQTGMQSISLGALDLLDQEPVLPIFDTGDRRLTTLKGRKSETDLSNEIPDGEFDLVIMNPPFTRPTSHESGKSNIPVPSFAGLETSNAEQKLMTDRLKKIYAQKDLVGNGYAGLASNFVDIAHKKVKEQNGVVALVLPSTFLKGDSWEDVRKLFETHYSDVVILRIASAGQSDRAFSADTNMAEILLVATRRASNKPQPVTYINLFRRPQSIVEAVMIARKFIRNPNASTIKFGGENIASVRTGDFDSTGIAGTISESPVNLAQNLKANKLVLPRQKKSHAIPVTALNALGEVGVSHRQIHGRSIGSDGLPIGPYELISPIKSKKPTYPILWHHDAKSETRLIVKPDHEGNVHKGCEEKAMDIWNKTKSRLHFNLDFQINSQPLAACLTEEESIGGRAWPNFICKNPDWEIPLLLWANTTIGLITFWWQGGRQQLGRAIITRKTLQKLLVLDVSKLNNKQIKQAVDIYEKFKDVEFKPSNEAWSDTARQDLDNAILIDLLGMPQNDIEDGLNTLRIQWCEEPTVHGGQKTSPAN